MKNLIIASAIACCAGAVCAQSTQPQFFIWGKPWADPNSSPPTPATWTDRQYIPLLHLWTGQQRPSATAVAESAADWFQDYVDWGWIDVDPNEPDNPQIAIVIQNFGHWHDGQALPSSFFHTDDELDPTPNWFSTPPAWGNYAQPWMTNGRPAAKQWMEDFLAAYSQQTFLYNGQQYPLPVPARFHMDTEVHVVNPFGQNQIRLMAAIGDDPRWYTEPVPGFGSQTMQDLYTIEIGLHGWPDLPLSHTSVLDQDEPTTHAANRKYWLWFDRVMRTAIDAAMKETVYEVVRDYYTALGKPVPLVSNYNYSDHDGVADTFGWWPRRDPPGQSSTPTWVPERAAPRAWPHPGFNGAYHHLNDLVYSASEYSVWLLQQHMTSGDFSAPRTYHLATTAVPQHAGPQYYLRDHEPTEDRAAASLRLNRQSVESILNSSGYANGPETITPWLLMVGANVQGSDPHTPEETRQHLAMLRAKDISEILLWQGSHVDIWEEFRDLVQQVYTPDLIGVQAWEGNPLNNDSDEDAVRYTLRDDEGQETIDVEGDIASIVVHFENLLPPPAYAPLGDHLRLNIELALEVLSPQWRDDARVRAYIWRTHGPNGPDWYEIDCECADYANEANAIGFWAPADPGSADLKYDLRRTLKMEHTSIEDTEIEIKVVVFSHSDTDIIARFDLVQVYWEGEPPGGGTIGTMTAGNHRGADVNYDGVVDQKDYDKFMDDYLHGRRAADFNNDGVVDAADLAAFLEAYNNQ